MENRSYVGMWWLPEATEKRIGGILTVEASGTCELQLTGSLLVNQLWGNGLDADEPLDEANRVVHGEASGEQFTWDRLNSDVGMGIHVLFGLDYERGGYLENRIMNAASAAESIHRALRPKATGLPAEEFKAALSKIKEALVGSENGLWFTGRLRNDPGFTDRMHQLAEIPHKEAVKALLQDVDQWAKWLRDARNAVAHLEGKALSKIPDDARYEIPAVTIALLHLVFLAELGLSPEIQMRAVEVVYGGATHNFRDAVQVKLDRESS
jgi:hypothetical protein